MEDENKGIRQSGKQAQILSQLRVHRARLESIYKQKVRENWLKVEDKNTKFFHASILIRRRRNHIVVVKHEDKWLINRKDIVEYFIGEFLELFSTTEPSIPLDLEGLVSPCTTEEENNNLMSIPQADEIKRCV